MWILQAAHENLINARLAHVSVSRARDDAHIFTNDATRLGEAFSKEVSQASAMELEATHRALTEGTSGQ